MSPGTKSRPKNKARAKKKTRAKTARPKKDARPTKKKARHEKKSARRVKDRGQVAKKKIKTARGKPRAQGTRATREREPVGALAFSRDGRRLALSITRGMSSKKTVGRVLIYDSSKEPKLLREVRVPGGVVELVALSPSGSFVACARRGERGVQLIDANTGKLVHTLVTSSPTALAFAPDGGRLAVGVYDADERAGRLVVLDAKGGAELFRSPPYRQDVIGISFLPDGLVAVGAMDWWGAFIAWDIDAGRELYRLPEFDDTSAPARRGRAVAASADGRSYATCDGTRVDVWSVDGGEKKSTIDVGSVPQTLALNRDGSVLFTGSPDAAAWSVGSGARLRSLEGPGLVGVHPDGQRVCVVSSVVIDEGPLFVPA